MQANPSSLLTRRAVKPASLLLALTATALVAIVALALTRADLAAPGTITVGPDDIAPAATLDVGQELDIALRANPSTGYQWVIASSDATLLAQVGEPVFAADSDLIGASGTMTFRFKALDVGECTLRLHYLRPWEDAAPLDIAELTVTVNR